MVTTQKYIIIKIYFSSSQDLGDFLPSDQHGRHLGCSIEHSDWSDQLPLRRGVNERFGRLRYRSMHFGGEMRKDPVPELLGKIPYC